MNTFVFCKKLKEMYGNNCNEFTIAEIEEATVYYFIPMLFGASCILYFKNNTNILSEILFQVCYKSFLAATKLSNACKRIRNFFVLPNSVETTTKTKAYIYDEIKVVKNGVRCASFETMKTFKDSEYLGNPNEYYDLDEDVEDSSFDSDLVSSPSSSSSSSSPSLSEDSTLLEPLYIADKNEDDNTVEFKNFDFIMHTNYKYPESSSMKQNYTKIYRTFTQYDFYSDKNKYEISNTEMIICILKIDGHETEYEIDLSKPYNFNVVGNLILDEKFVHWYIIKKYNYIIESSMNYNITCITNSCKKYELDRSCGLRVHLYDYEKTNSKTELLRKTYFLHL